MSEEFDASQPASQPLSVPSGPLEVRPGCHLVGHRNPASLLQCNTYIRTFTDGNVYVDRQEYQAVVKVLNRLTWGEDTEFCNQLRSDILALCSELGVPIPPIGIGIEQNAPPRALGSDGVATQAWWMSELDAKRVVIEFT